MSVKYAQLIKQTHVSGVPEADAEQLTGWYPRDGLLAVLLAVTAIIC